MRYMYGPDLLARISRIDEYNLMFFLGPILAESRSVQGDLSKGNTTKSLCFFQQQHSTFCTQIGRCAVARKVVELRLCIADVEGTKGGFLGEYVLYDLTLLAN